METWQRTLTSVDRIREHTAPDVLDRLDHELQARLSQARTASPAQVAARIDELDREWDVERVLIVNAAAFASLGVLRGIVRRRPPLLPLVITGFLLQHGLQGWCPPLALFRRLRIRTRREIDLERYILKVLRGDLGGETTTHVGVLLEQAVRR